MRSPLQLIGKVIFLVFEDAAYTPASCEVAGGAEMCRAAMT